MGQGVTCFRLPCLFAGVVRGSEGESEGVVGAFLSEE